MPQDKKWAKEMDSLAENTLGLDGTASSSIKPCIVSKVGPSARGAPGPIWAFNPRDLGISCFLVAPKWTPPPLQRNGIVSKQSAERTGSGW